MFLYISIHKSRPPVLQSCRWHNNKFFLPFGQADVGTPLPETPDFGGLEVAVDCSPCALQV